MLIVAALNLPYTVEFTPPKEETNENESNWNPQQILNQHSVVTPNERPPEPRDQSGVPFDSPEVKPEGSVPPLKPSRDLPQKYIVDERKPLEARPITVNTIPHQWTSHRRRRASSIARLPWKIVRQHRGNPGLLNAVLRADSDGLIESPKWVGLLGIATDAIVPRTRSKISEELFSHRCYPTYVPDAQLAGHYDNYCKEFLWPTFHSQVPVIPTSKAYEDYSWGDYVAVNQAIADKVCEIWRPGDYIWVHDYHLLLVPKMIRDKLKDNAPIGFFLHVAFPTSELFKCLAYRLDLMKGIVAANAVGFHIQNYVQHFMMSAARILAVDFNTNPDCIETEDRDVFVMACPIGLDSEKLDSLISSEAVLQHRRVIRRRWAYPMKIICGRDKADPIRGLRQKLKAFEMFLDAHPEQATKVVFVQIVLNSNDESTEWESLAGRINSKFGDPAIGLQPVVLVGHDVVFEQYVALMAEADAFAITSLREGLNLTCHEYAFCQKKSNRNGVLILSEFTGSATIFKSQAMLVNPWNIKQLSRTYYQAVVMPDQERQSRSTALYNRVLEHSSTGWVQKNVGFLQRAWEEDLTRLCNRPDVDQLTEIYQSSNKFGKRVFLLELEASRTHLYTDRIFLVLGSLVYNKDNVVYVLSAESPTYMEHIYRQIPGIGLIAEFGRYVRMYGEDEWQDLGGVLDNDWQNRIEPILELIREKVAVENVQVHESSVVVDFPQPEAGGEDRELNQMGEYSSVINSTFSCYGVRCKPDRNQLTIYTNEIGALRLNAYRRVISSVTAPLGMLLIANQSFNTDSDDVIYAWAEEQRARGITRELVTIVLGKHPTYARTMVDGENALLLLLQQITG